MVAADLGAVARLQLNTALDAYAPIFGPDAPKPTLDEMIGSWEEVLSRGQGWVATDGDDVIGSAGLVPEPEGARIVSVYVRRDRWGDGVGGRLVETAVGVAGERGWSPLRLWVLEANTRARRWYERKGWVREEDRRRTVWEDVDDVGYILRS